MKWVKRILLAIIAVFVLFIAFGAYISSSNKTNDKATEQTAKIEVKDFGKTPQQISDEIFALIGRASKQDFGKPKLKSAEGHFVTDLLPNVLQWQGSGQSNGNSDGFTYTLFMNKASQQDMLVFAFHAGALMRVLNPDLPKEQTAGAFIEFANEVKDKAAQTKELAVGKRTFGVAEVEIKIQPENGLWVTNITHVD